MAYGSIKADGVVNSDGATFNLAQATTSEATTSAKGYMSAADKTKLDGLGGSSGAFAETGTWTPKMIKTYSGGGGVVQHGDFYTHTYIKQTGTYVRVGKQVTISYELQNPGTIVRNSSSPVQAQAFHIPYLANLPYPIADNCWATAPVGYFAYLTGLDGYTYGPNTYGPWVGIGFRRANGTLLTGQGFILCGHESEQAAIYDIPSEHGFGVAYGHITGTITYITDDTTETPFNGATADT